MCPWGAVVFVGWQSRYAGVTFVLTSVIALRVSGVRFMLQWQRGRVRLMQTDGVNRRFAHCMDMLAKSPLFAGVSREELPRVLVLMRARCHSFAKGEVLQGFGEPFRYVGILMSGEVEGSFDSERFDRINVNRFTAGQMYGAAFACARVPESPIELVALRPSEVVLLDVGVLGTGGQPDALEAVLLRNLLGIVSTQSVFLNRKVRILGQHSLRDRIVVYLGGLAADADGWVTVPLSQTALAQFIGGNRSAVSREIGRMVDEGVLERDGRRMRLAGSLRRLPRHRPR